MAANSQRTNEKASLQFIQLLRPGNQSKARFGCNTERHGIFASDAVALAVLECPIGYLFLMPVDT